jgi:hypothetical protein
LVEATGKRHRRAAEKPRMTDNQPDPIDAVGKHISTVFIALLAAMFVYGYLGHFLLPG